MSRVQSQGVSEHSVIIIQKPAHDVLGLKDGQYNRLKKEVSHKMHMNADSWKALGHHATYGLNAQMDATRYHGRPYIDNAGIPEHFTRHHVLPLRKGENPVPPPRNLFPIGQDHRAGSSQSRSHGQSQEAGPSSSGRRRVAPAVQPPRTQGGSSRTTGHSPQRGRKSPDRLSAEFIPSTPQHHASPTPGRPGAQKTVAMKPKVVPRVQRKPLRPPSPNSSKVQNMPAHSGSTRTSDRRQAITPPANRPKVAGPSGNQSRRVPMARAKAASSPTPKQTRHNHNTPAKKRWQY